MIRSRAAAAISGAIASVFVSASVMAAPAAVPFDAYPTLNDLDPTSSFSALTRDISPITSLLPSGTVIFQDDWDGDVQWSDGVYTNSPPTADHTLQSSWTRTKTLGVAAGFSYTINDGYAVTQGTLAAVGSPLSAYYAAGDTTFTVEGEPNGVGQGGAVISQFGYDGETGQDDLTDDAVLIRFSSPVNAFWADVLDFEGHTVTWPARAVAFLNGVSVFTYSWGWDSFAFNANAANPARPGNDEVLGFGIYDNLGQFDSVLLIVGNDNFPAAPAADERWAIANLGFAVVPEPTSLGIFGLGGLMLARRRRA